MFFNPSLRRKKRTTHKSFNFSVRKDIGFQLPSLGLPNEVKTSQNNSSIPSTVVSSQQTTLSETQNTSQSLYTLFGETSNAAPIRNPKSHGFQLQQSMVSPPAPTFPSESLDIPPITPQTSNPSLLRFSSDHIQNSTLPNSIRTQQLQNIQNTTNMLTESVSHFTDHTIDENTDLVEGPLDKIVDQIMDRELNEAIMKTSTLSNTFGQHPTFTNTPSQVPSSCAGSFQHGVGGHDTTNSIPATQSGSTQTVQKNLPAHSQSQFTLQPPGSVSSKVVRSLAQASVAGLTQNRSQQKAGALQNVNKIEELLNLQESASSSTSKVEQKQFLNQLSKPAQTSFSSANPANNGVSTASRGNINLTLPLDIKILQSQTQTNSQNELNRTQNNNPQKLAFVTSVGTSSSTNSASQIIKSQGLNIQRSLAKQGTGILSSVHETSSQNISRTGSQADVSNMQALLQTLARTPGLLSNSNQSLSKTGINNLPSQLGTSLPTVAGTKPNLMQGSVTTKTNQRDNFSIFKETSSSSNPSNSLPTHLGKSQSTVSVTKSSLMQGNVTPKTSQLTSFSIFNEESTSANSSNSLASHLGTSQSTMSGTNSSLTQGTMTPNTSQLNKNFSIFTEAGSSSIPTNSMTSHLDALQPAVSTTKPNLTQGSTTPDTIRLNKNFSIFTEANTSTKLSDSMIAHLDTLQSTISATKPNLTQGNMVPDTSQLKNFSIFTEANTSTNPSTNTKSHLSTSQANVSATNSNLTQGTMNHNTSQLNKNFPIFTETSSVNKSSNNMSSHLGTSQPTFSATKPNLTQGIINQILQSIPKQTGSEPSTALISNQTLPAVALAQSIATTSLKITSPSANISSTFQLQISEPSQNVSSLQGTIFSQASPRLSTSNGQSVTPTSSNMHVFSKYQLSQPKVSGIVSKTSGTSSMMFTLSPGSQGATTLKALSVAGKDKLAGRQIFLLQQPRQMLKNPKQQPVKIIFVNDGSVRQVVSGPQKSNAGSSSTAMASKQSPVQAEVQRPTNTVQPVQSPGTHTPEGSPSSINSSDSDVLPIAVIKKTETLKKKEKPDGAVEKKKRGAKRKKDPNKPVKPLSTFQRFFQKTQAVIRQQDPNASFSEVSKIAKQMWENLGAKERKVYQDEWRTERAQYKKALEEYKAGLNEDEVDGPTPKALKNGQSAASPVPVSLVDGPGSEIVPSSAASGSVPVSGPAPNSTTGGPHGSGKPLAMMVELANKTKMASGQASGKTLGPAKSSSATKVKGPGNDVDDVLLQITKQKKPKINPIPKKSCIRENCNKVTKTTKERGTLFCSNECVMLHCRGVFKSWVDARRATFKAAS